MTKSRTVQKIEAVEDERRFAGTPTARRQPQDPEQSCWGDEMDPADEHDDYEQEQISRGH